MKKHKHKDIRSAKHSTTTEQADHRVDAAEQTVPRLMKVAIAKITIDPEIQPREHLNDDVVVREYADASLRKAGW